MTIIKILECKPRAWFVPISWAIRLYHMLFRGSKWSDGSHFALSYTPELGRSMAVDASAKSVRLMTLDKFEKKYIVLKETDVRIEYKLTDFIYWYQGLLGEMYGYMQYISILIDMRIFSKGVICNELVLKFLKRFTKYDGVDLEIKDLEETRQIIRSLNGNE